MAEGSEGTRPDNKAFFGEARSRSASVGGSGPASFRHLTEPLMSHARRGRSSPTEKFLPGWVLELTIGHIREPLSLSLFSESVEIEEVCDVVLER